MKKQNYCIKQNKHETSVFAPIILEQRLRAMNRSIRYFHASHVHAPAMQRSQLTAGALKGSLRQLCGAHCHVFRGRINQRVVQHGGAPAVLRAAYRHAKQGAHSSARRGRLRTRLLRGRAEGRAFRRRAHAVVAQVRCPGVRAALRRLPATRGRCGFAMGLLPPEPLCGRASIRCCSAGRPPTSQTLRAAGGAMKPCQSSGSADPCPMPKRKSSSRAAVLIRKPS